MYYGDFDNNGSTETVLSQGPEGAQHPLLSLDEISSQLIYLRKKYTDYRSFAGQTMTQIFSPELLSQMLRYDVTELRSGYLQNNEGNFTFVAFSSDLQTAPIQAFETYDFNADGKDEVLLGGNLFGVIPFHGRFDSFAGAVLNSDNKAVLSSGVGLDFKQKSVRHLKVIELNKKPYLLAVYNNDKTEIYELLSNPKND